MPKNYHTRDLYIEDRFLPEDKTCSGCSSNNGRESLCDSCFEKKLLRLRMIHDWAMRILPKSN